MPSTVAVVGECMLELSQLNAAGTAENGQSAMQFSFGGDTLNTALYLARLFSTVHATANANVQYVTALGDDSMSDWMLSQWMAEGVGCDLVERYPDSVPGLYLIQTDETGERSFLYWRDSAPAKRLFDDATKAKELFARLAQHDWIYLSGITLSLYSEAALERLLDFLARYRAAGGRIAFDGNYRPRLWPSASSAQDACEALYRLTAVALPSLDDELLLFGDADSDAVVDRLRSLGVEEIVLKMGEQGCRVVSGSEEEKIESHTVGVVDTTAAGDSFNAGYLAAKMAGCTLVRSAEEGRNLASAVIACHGAIIPKENMPSVS
ncbi:MAG: sugar kinase [Halioglobus sp.]